MSTSLMYHAFGVRGYQYVRTEYQEGETVFTIRQEDQDLRRPDCGSKHVIRRGTGEPRLFLTTPIGVRGGRRSSSRFRVSSARTAAWSIK